MRCFNCSSKVALGSPLELVALGVVGTGVVGTTFGVEVATLGVLGALGDPSC